VEGVALEVGEFDEVGSAREDAAVVGGGYGFACAEHDEVYSLLYVAFEVFPWGQLGGGVHDDGGAVAVGYLYYGFEGEGVCAGSDCVVVGGCPVFVVGFVEGFLGGVCLDYFAACELDGVVVDVAVGALDDELCLESLGVGG